MKDLRAGWGGRSPLVGQVQPGEAVCAGNEKREARGARNRDDL